MAVNRLGEYLRQDPQTAAFLANLQQQAASANTGTHLGGLSSLVNNLTRGYVMGQDKDKRRALSKALTSSSNTPTKIIPGSAGQIDPGVSEAEIFAAPDEYDSIRPSSGEYLTKPVAARIDPQSGPVYGRTESLNKLLSENPNNQYVSRALLSNQDQLAARNNRFKLAEMNNQNKLATLQDTRVHAAGQQQATRDYERTVAEVDAFNKEKLERIKLGGKDTRTSLMKNLQAQGLVPGTQQYQEAMAAGLKKGPLIQQVGESAYKKEMGKLRAQKYGKVIESRDDAAKTNFYLSQALAAIDDPIGVASAFTTSIGTFATQLGLKLGDKWEKKLTASQKFQGLMGNILAAKLALQKGPQTNEDANRMERTMANLGNTKEARIFFIKSMTALNNRTIEKATFYENWETQKGSIKGAEKEWQKSIAKMPLIAIRKTANGGDQPILYNDFLKESRKANPAYSNSEIKEIWIKRYGS